MGKKKSHGRNINPKGKPIKINKPLDFAPVATFEDGRPRCTAWARTGKNPDGTLGRQCQQRAMKSKAVCYWHGGRAGRPSTGKFDFIGRLGEIDKRLLGRDMLELSSEMRLNVMRIQQIVERVEAGEPVPDVPAMRESLRNIQSGILTGNTSAVSRAASDLTKMLDVAECENAEWERINKQVLISDKLTRSSTANELRQETTFSLQEVAWVMASIIQVLKIIMTGEQVVKFNEFAQNQLTGIPMRPMSSMDKKVKQALILADTVKL